MSYEKRYFNKQKKKPFVSIIIPTRMRAKLFSERLRKIKENTPEFSNGTAELIVVVDSDDPASINMKGIERRIIVPPLTTPANKWNEACKHALGEWLVTISDDCIPQKDWLRNALIHTENKGFIGLPDGVSGDRNRFFTPLYMATRSWLRKYHGGVLVIPWYKSWYADVETAQRAHRSSTYTVGWTSEVKQLHSIFGTAPSDEIYRIGEMRRAEDLQMFNLRASNGFRDDFEAVI